MPPSKPIVVKVTITTTRAINAKKKNEVMLDLTTGQLFDFKFKFKFVVGNISVNNVGIYVQYEVPPVKKFRRRAKKLLSTPHYLERWGVEVPRHWKTFSDETLDNFIRWTLFDSSPVSLVMIVSAYPNFDLSKLRAYHGPVYGFIFHYEGKIAQMIFKEPIDKLKREWYVNTFMDYME